MPTVLITGGTGLIGNALTGLLIEKDYSVIILTRGSANRQRLRANVQYAQWDVNNQTIDANAIAQADHIIHLAGAGIADKRWSAKRKKEIAESRIQGSALLLKGLQETPNKVKSVVSASGIGWYGADPKIPNPRPFVETDPSAEGFLGETCKRWEESIQQVDLLKKRVVMLRTGIVLSNEGGALKEFKKPAHLGVAAILGSGKQIISWIHILDLCRTYIYAIENESVMGCYNAVAPVPVSNKDLTLLLTRAIKKNFYLPMHVPSWALRLFLGEMSIEVLKSTTVSAEKIRNQGFKFVFPAIESALSDLLQKSKPAEKS